MVLPKRCFNCGNVFDLSYDFKEGEEPGFLVNSKGKEIPKEFLCYYCRDKEKDISSSSGSEENLNFLSDDLLNEEDY